MNKDSSSISIVCASLRHRKDRRFILEHYYPQVLGQQINFFEAVDGAFVSEQHLRKMPPRTPPNGYATRLTKLLILRTFLRSSFDHLIFLEDDVVLSEDFESVVRDAVSEQLSLVFLGGGHPILHSCLALP